MSARARTRADVQIRARDAESESGYAGEWVHTDGLEIEELGVWLRWDGREKTFVPWASVIRIDYSACRCVECERAVRHDDEGSP